jgi:adenosylhomocysteine nucleosidase
MRILVTFAVDAEFAPWRSRHAFVPYEFDDSGRRREFDLFRANIGADEVTVLLTAMGCENAKKAMHTIPFEIQDVCISAGLAGALEADLRERDIVVARSVEAIHQTQNMQSDTDLSGFAIACGARLVNTFLTSDAIIATASEKQMLRASGSVVEMESSQIFAAARERQLPVVAVRAISDSADEDLPVDFQRIADSRGHLKVGGLLKELALHPYRLPLLVQFGRQSRSAAVSLADFLDRYVPVISKHWQKARSTNAEEVAAT